MSSALIAASALTTQARINYPDTRRVDIIDMRSDTGTDFCPEWHTMHDTMDAIDPATLGEVGQTLLNVIAALEQ